MLIVCGFDRANGFGMSQACMSQGEYSGQIVVLNNDALINEFKLFEFFDGG